MEKIIIREYTPGDAPQMADVQARCLDACPDTSRFPPGFWNGPGFENGRNIFCAIDGHEELLGYVALTKSYVSKRLDGARILWFDLRVDPSRIDAEAIKDILFGRAFTRARQIARRLPREKAVLSATYFAEGAASIDYLNSRGFVPYQVCYTMRRNLAEPVPKHPLPEGVVVRPWRMETEAEQQAYMEAYHAAFQSESKNLEELQRFLQSELWSVGTTFTAFVEDHIVGSVAVYYHPRKGLVGRTETVFVVPEWRRRGITRTLLEHSLMHLREAGLAYAELEMDSTNKAAMALYESLGYRVFKDEVSLGRFLAQ